MANEGAEMQYIDDPITFCRLYRFTVRVKRERLLNKYVAFWFVLKCMWGVLRHGK